MARTQLERTGRLFKALMVIGVLLAVYGVISFVANKDTNPGTGIVPMVFGFVIFLFGKFLAWWKHG